MKQEKEWLYIGYYFDENNDFILKVGTTNDLEVRRKQHNNYYRNKASHNRMPKENEFHYIWSWQFSKYTTLRLEDKTKAEWKELGFGEYVNNDRFLCAETPQEVEVNVRKKYKIEVDRIVQSMI